MVIGQGGHNGVYVPRHAVMDGQQGQEHAQILSQNAVVHSVLASQVKPRIATREDAI